jgi:mRNA interferase YafQ
MRKIEPTSQFKKDYKRQTKGHYRKTLENDFKKIVTALAEDKQLDSRNRDHALTGNWKDHRDCHIKPDLVLIYRKPDKNKIQLVRIGSHSELNL